MPPEVSVVSCLSKDTQKKPMGSEALLAAQLWCSKKSDAKIEMTIITTNLLQTGCVYKQTHKNT